MSARRSGAFANWSERLRRCRKGDAPEPPACDWPWRAPPRSPASAPRPTRGGPADDSATPSAASRAARTLPACAGSEIKYRKCAHVSWGFDRLTFDRPRVVIYV
eukprot:3862170-Pyramimonas_sp.AAC.2